MLRAPVVVMIIAIAATSCYSREATPVVSQASKEPEKTQPAPAVGRFVVLSTQSAVIRMDTSTGETWKLNLATGPRWESLEDNPRPIGTYNADTKKIEWGTPLPDGRDLHDLSKEEILRWIEPILKKNPGSNAKDPLGLFDEPKVKQE